MYTHRTQNNQGFRAVRALLVLLALLALIGPTAVLASNPAPVQVYYLTLPEADALQVLDAINSAADTPVNTYFSIAIGVSGTYVYYDQWENGYDSDIANPTNLYSTSNPGGTQIWGNGEADDGCPPNKNGVAIACTDANDVFVAGDIVIPDNTVALSGFAASYVLDQFGSAAYNLNSGNVNWSTNWVEANDDNSPTAGSMLITSGVLRFQSTTGVEAGDSIARGVTLPAGGACAALTFVLGQSGIDANEDRLAVQVSADGGATYTTLEVFDAAADASAKWYSVANFATNTRVRFLILDELETGEYWSVDNVQVAWGCPTRDSSVIRFDGRDKIGASRSIAMARAAWATGSGTLNAFAHEMYATAEWGTAYEAPVGVDTANAGQMFEFSGLSIMAAENNTTVQIDADANGTYETSVALQEGGSYLITGTRQGARVLADKPVQVLLVTGDVGSSYASRDMALLPESAYGSSAWSPVGVDTDASGPTRLFLYNPTVNNTSIYITCERYGAANTTLGPVAVRGAVTLDLVNGQGARCFASDASGNPTTHKLFGVGTIDALATAYDWSFTLYPDAFLSTEALVGLGLGRDPTSSTNPNENGGPLWVTAACTTGGTYVYVDWDNNGTADLVDLNGDGDTLDTVDGISESTSNNGMLVARLQSVRLFEPPLDAEPYDQSGARVWSRTASGVGQGGTPGCNLALAWGQDPRTASAGAPGLDVGVTVPPLRMIEGAKSLALKTDADSDGVLSPGDTVTYLISVKNTGGGTVNNVYVYDTVPAHTDYVANSTQKDTGGGWQSIPDDSSGTPFPLDAPGGVLLGNLGAGATFYVRFDVTLRNINPEPVYEEVQNCATAYTAAGTVRSCVTNLVAANEWGDLPDSYGTSLAANGPRHSLAASGLRLGTYLDRDLQGQPSLAADGDDLNQTTLPKADDEDGVAVAGTAYNWENGNAAFSVTVSNAAGCLNAWMDFTNDSGATPPASDGNFTKVGGYDTATVGSTTYSEHIVQNVKVNPGANNVTATVPPGLVSAPQQYFYFRFRLSPTDGAGNCTAAVAPTGFVAGGEVEDYRFDLPDLGLASIGDRIWRDDDSDGVQDTGEVGVGGVVVYIDANNNGVRDPGERYAVTDANGAYVIDQLAAGTYLVRVDRSTLPAGYFPTYDLDGGRDDKATVTVSAGQQRQDVDFGYKPGLVAGIIFPDPLQTEAAPGSTVWFVQSWTNLADTTDRGNITVYNLPNGWGLEVYRDASSSAPAVGVYTSLSCPSTTCLHVATESSGDRTVLDNNDTITSAQDTGSDGIPDSGDLAPNGGTTKVILKVTVPSSAKPGVYPLRERGSSQNDWWANHNPYGRAYNDNLVYHDEALKIVTIPGATLGDRVWLDEDSDGVQDAGEAGIANVRVYLDTNNNGQWDANEPYTVTDVTGAYVFTDLAPGTYVVRVDTSTMPAGLAANPTFDYDGLGTAHAATVTISAWQEMMAADFGYNWAATGDVDGGAGTGAIAGTVWSDAGDGVRSLGEIGLAGVTVALWYDSNNDGVIDAQYAATTAGPDGGYVFDDLPAGIYEVRVTAPSGYTQTGDPDGVLDSKTTAPILLAPGDVYVNADFGYRPAASSTVGDRIYLDTNSDGVFDGSDYGIPGVTVVLLDSQGRVIATTVTDANGYYAFPALPAGTYTVWVNDTAHVLDGLAQTGDPDTTLDRRHTLTVDGSSAYLANDFGFTPAGHSGVTGLIGDVVYLDRDGQNDYDPGEGLEGVRVRLYDSTGTILLATTYTDENGRYAFGGLAPGTFVVKVDTTTLPNGGSGLVNSVDPDAGTAHQSSVTLTAAGQVNLLQDFGYVPATPNRISGTIWTDADADGFMDEAETGWLAGVTVVLRDSSGRVVGRTVTDSYGAYSFANLPDGTYTVDVTDEYGVLSGYWHSQGTANTDGHSQADPLSVTVSGGVHVTYADFGYYLDPGTAGDRVWYDLDGDGIQDAGEPGIAGVPVVLTITYPNGAVVTVRTVTDANGAYSFTNLLLDEDHDGVGIYGSGGNEPKYVITVAAPSNYLASPANQGSDDSVDSDDGVAGEQTQPAQGSLDDTNDFGFFQTDWGDLPDSFGTLAGSNGPRHILYPDVNADHLPDAVSGWPAAVWLGSIVDRETTGQPASGATGDDSGGADDEDGLVQPSWDTNTGKLQLQVTVGATGSASGLYLAVWINWNNNGTFETAPFGSGGEMY
ncbi:MAG: carboxypeptidase regulatory-like domain-containing protein, partial [Caldilineales bacterium]|nr:carboxypeptidase regulatory-like domain-containing protein [Caldilineales bacterium]